MTLRAVVRGVFFLAAVAFALYLFAITFWMLSVVMGVPK